MKSEDEQRLHELANRNILTIAGNYASRWFVAEDRERELEVIRDELSKNTSMSGISNAIWASMQEMLEKFSTKKS